MGDIMEIAFISTEVFPFAKVGGLGDVSLSLPLALAQLKNKVSIFMPFYKSIDKKAHTIRKYPKWEDFSIKVGETDFSIGLYKAKYENLTVYFIENEALYGRDGIYTDKTGEGYKDNHIRDIFFSKAVIEVIKKINEKFDIIHINDSHTALTAPYLKTVYNNEEIFKDTKVVLTIHNLGSAYQGIHEAIEVKTAGLSYDYFYQGGPFEYYDKFNFLKAGIHFADLVTTVSPQYAKEIQTNELGEGLQGVLSASKDKLLGIINGIDTNIWNPETDNHIPHKYNLENIKDKLKNKKDLLKKLNLNADVKVPLIGMISRIVDQKGFDILSYCFNDLMQENVNFVLLGSGQKRYEEIFTEFAKKYPEKVAVITKYDEELSHLIEAGSDIFLMPSKYEPCGLNQLYSLKYGTIPLVRATGGLEDSVLNYFDDKENGTGFKFNDYTPSALLNTVKEALKIYSNDKEWKKIVKNGMSLDLSWSASAKKYLDLYQSIL